MLRRLAAFVLVFVLCSGALAAQTLQMDPTPPSRAQVLSLLTAMGIRETVENSLKNAQQRIKASAHAAYLKRNPKADAATLKKLDDVFDSTPIFGFDDISEALVSVYQKNLDASDVQAGIDFYTSATGQRLIHKVNAIIREANEASQELVQEKLQNYADTLTRKLQAFDQENRPQPSTGDPSAPAGSGKPASGDAKPAPKN